MPPSSRVTTVQSPLGRSPAAASRGGQFFAQPPLHMLLPAPDGSLSKVYRVMPALSVKIPPDIWTPPGADMLAQPAARAMKVAAASAANRWIIECSPFV